MLSLEKFVLKEQLKNDNLHKFYPKPPFLQISITPTPKNSWLLGDRKNISREIWKTLRQKFLYILICKLFPVIYEFRMFYIPQFLIKYISEVRITSLPSSHSQRVAWNIRRWSSRIVSRVRRHYYPHLSHQI